MGTRRVCRKCVGCGESRSRCENGRLPTCAADLAGCAHIAPRRGNKKNRERVLPTEISGESLREAGRSESRGAAFAPGSLRVSRGCWEFCHRALGG